jgi:Uma2 family endonuclease
LEAIAQDQIRPLRRAEYDKLVSLGVFQDEHIELLFGQLVEMSAIGPPHSSAVQKLTAIFVRACGDRAAVRVLNPFAALDHSEPEPDLAVVPPGDYDTEHPSIAWLVIEVAESSLARDRGLKQRLYAECGVPEYWIVNLVDRRIEVHVEPSAGAYSKVTPYRKGQVIRLQRFVDVEVRVDDVLK